MHSQCGRKWHRGRLCVNRHRIRTRESGSQATRCWRETDSNFRSPVKKSQFLETVCADFFRHFPSERPNPSAFASRNVSAGNSGTPGYLQDDPSIQQPLSGSAGDLIDHAGVRSRCVAPSPSTAWRRASRRALRCGQPACAWKWRRRHGSDEPPCMQRRFPAASCRLPEQGPDR